MTSANEMQVLIVDDNRQMRHLVRALLRSAGVYRVAEAESAIEAFDLMRRFPIDLVLVDWMMKPIDGIGFTRSVRMSQESPSPYVPILMMTAHTEKWRVAAARDAGVSGFVRKPLSTRILFDRMSAALLDDRAFIRTADFCGPDRRRAPNPDYPGPFRRATDKGDTVDLDDMRWTA